MHYLFQIKSQEHLSQAQEKLLHLGFEHLYVLEEKNHWQLGGYHKEDLTLDLPLIKKEADPQVDWNLEWELHAPHFSNGLVTYPLANGKTLLMQPGPGFGDLAHPTTQLCLEALEELVKDATVFDLGSGSGVLSIAAKLFGAKKVYGIEIDPAAITHAKANLSLNKLDNIEFIDHLPPIPKGELVCVLNMTLSEQEALFASYPQLHEINAKWIVSGLLQGQADAVMQKEDWILSTSSPACQASRPFHPSQEASRHP